MVIRRFTLAFAALALAASSLFRLHVVDPVAAAFGRLADFIVRTTSELFAGDPLLFDTGAGRAMRWQGGDPLEPSLQRSIEHDRNHLKRSAARHC